jgi:hypothetical protein
VHVGGKPAWYLFDRGTLPAFTGATGIVRCAMPWPEFADRWQRQRPAGGAGGWQMIGLAEPLVSVAGLALPPHAMRRDERQVLLWPTASSADVAAVRALHAADLAVLAIRLPSCSEPLPAEIAAVDGEAGPAEIVTALNARWGGGRADAGAQALEGLLAEVEARGFISEIQVGEALGCGSLDELPGRLRALDPARGIYMPGVGLCSPSFAEAMRRGLRRKPRRRPAA